MLHRPPFATLRGKRPATRKARYRQRQRDGRMMVTIEIDAALVDLLCRTGWLSNCTVAERGDIARAIERLLADAARG
jgi:hypothetical protein